MDKLKRYECYDTRIGEEMVCLDDDVELLESRAEFLKAENERLKAENEKLLWELASFEAED